MPWKVILIAVLAPILMGAYGDGGCSQAEVPSARIVEARIPLALRKCAGIPVSPGGKASDAQSARYTIKLYYALRNCKGNLGSVDSLLTKYESEIAAGKAAGWIKE